MNMNRIDHKEGSTEAPISIHDHSPLHETDGDGALRTGCGVAGTEAGSGTQSSTTTAAPAASTKRGPIDETDGKKNASDEMHHPLSKKQSVGSGIHKEDISSTGEDHNLKTSAKSHHEDQKTALPSEKLSTSEVGLVVAAEKDDPSSSMTSKDYYFDSYSHYGIHEEMLKDRVRTETYRAAILDNHHLFKDKIVLDVGCGTGILSMFAAQAGAKHVYGIDCSAIIDTAKILLERNGFSDRVTLIKGKAEEVSIPFENDPENFRQVDIIVSEWMGYCLLYESMLDTVLFARDKWLVPNGIIFPDKAVMYICAAEDAQYKADRIDYWKNVYGFDFSPIREIAIQEPLVDVVEGKSIVTNAVPILDVDILTCKKEDLAFSAAWSLTAHRSDYIHGFVAYFECAFTQVPRPIGFSTSPFSNYTHWKQTVFYLSDHLTICQGERIYGTIDCKPNKKNNRDLDIKLSVKLDGIHSKFDGEMDYCLR